MRFVDEFRDPSIATRVLSELQSVTSRAWSLMEICGGQTHALLRYGIDACLPPSLNVVHGPGCPVCVTPIETIDLAAELALQPDTTVVSYGDMLRVPGSGRDLFEVRALGGDVRVVYSPLESLNIARAQPRRRVVLFAIGFETTAPAHALTVQKARREGLSNFLMLVSHVLVPPAMRLLLGDPENAVQGLIAPGHVCSVMGCREYRELSRDYNLPVVVGGFEPLDLLQSILMLVRQLEAGRAELEIQYARCVRGEGNTAAQAVVDAVFEPTDRCWRGIGLVPGGGLRLRPEYDAFDAERVCGLKPPAVEEAAECISGLVLQGRAKPGDCTAFGTSCTPEHPVGAPMVSAEGACAAYFRYGNPQREPSTCRV